MHFETICAISLVHVNLMACDWGLRKQLPDYIFKLHFILLRDSMFVGD